MALGTTNFIFINLGSVESFSVRFGPTPLSSHLENLLLWFVGVLLLENLINISAIQIFTTIMTVPHALLAQ